MAKERDRKTALATAGAVAIGAMTAALAIGANFGLFGLTGSAADEQPFVPASATEDTTTSTTMLEPVIETRIVDVPVDDGGGLSGGSVVGGGSDGGASGSGPSAGPSDTGGPSLDGGVDDHRGPSDNSGPGSTSSGRHHDHHDDDHDEDDDDLDDDPDDDHGRNRGRGGDEDDD